MDKFRIAFATIMLALASSLAHAEIKSPIWNCSLTFEARGGGVQLLVGHFELEGQGRVLCLDTLGNREEIPVNVRLGGVPLALRAGIGMFQVAGIASGVGIAGKPMDLMGSYLVAGATGAIGVGAGAQVALHATGRSLTLNGALQAVSGLGLNVGFDFFEMTPSQQTN